MKALICGINGQDGSHLASLLLEKGYEVIGTSRDAMASSFGNLERLNIKDRITAVSMALNDFRSVFSIVKQYEPDEIYNLAGQSSVGLSFDQPVETMESIVTGTLNLLEAIRFTEIPIRFYNAGSSECFGNTEDTAATEETPFKPRSPYAVAKVAAYGLVSNYREAYGLFASTGILYNHESALRPERFVTQKVVRAATRIALGSGEKLRLGDLSICRDWGWAPEYVEAMWLMLQHDVPDDFIVATGRTVSLEYFVRKVFESYNLDWLDYVEKSNVELRPADIRISKGDPSKVHSLLGWRHRNDVDNVIEMMCRGAHNFLATRR